MERFTRAAAVLGIRVPRLSGRRVRYIVSLMLATALLPAGSATAAGSLSAASVVLSDPRPGVTSDYTFTGSSVDGATPILCVKVVWSTSASGDTAPAGFSGASGSVAAGSSTLINSSATNWSLAKSDGTSSAGQNNIYQYTNSAAGVTPSTTSGATFVLSGITNSTTPDVSYVFKINTYGNIDCSSSPIDHATVLYINTTGSTLSATIDPTLSFSVNGMSSSTGCDGTTTTATSTATTIPFGTVTSGANSIACQDLQASTNATHGYTIYLRYTAPPTSGINTIADSSGSNASPAAFTSPGTEAYGYSTDDASLGTGTADRFTNPSQGWAAATTSNAEVGYESAGVSTTHYHIAHQVGVATSTYPGTYSTTIIYTCTPVY